MSFLLIFFCLIIIKEAYKSLPSSALICQQKYIKSICKPILILKSMKCPNCGHNNPPQGTPDGKCDECGYTLFRDTNNDLAELSDRLIAQIIDSLVAIAAIFISFLLSIFFLNRSNLISTIIILSGLLLAVFYILFADGFKGGQSYGKRLMNIYVIDAKSKRPCTFIQSFGRNFSLAFLGIIDWIFIFSEKRQRFGDLLANTIVIRKKPPSQY